MTEISLKLTQNIDFIVSWSNDAIQKKPVSGPFAGDPDRGSFAEKN